MPIYEYHCDKCDREITLTLMISQHEKGKIGYRSDSRRSEVTATNSAGGRWGQEVDPPGRHHATSFRDAPERPSERPLSRCA